MLGIETLKIVFFDTVKPWPFYPTPHPYTT